MILVSQCLAGDFCRWDGGTSYLVEKTTVFEEKKSHSQFKQIDTGLNR